MKPSPSPCREPRLTLADLIDEWLPKLAVNAGAALDAKTQAVFHSVWLDGLGDLPPEVLRAAFQVTLRTCKFWPVKVADIREHAEHAKETATDEAAEQAWQYVLDLRRRFWNPDMPGGFSRGMPKLSPRIERAARAAGVFRDHDTLEALHVWAKKKFLESFLRWDETVESQNLLPEGEIKTLLAGVAQAKMLAAPSPDWSECRARGEAYRAQLATQGVPALLPEERLRIADELAAAARKVLEQPREHVIVASDEARIALRRQAGALKRSFPMSPEAFTQNPMLRKLYERFGLEIPEPIQTQSEPQAVEA